MNTRHSHPSHLLVADGGSTKTAWQLTLAAGGQYTFTSRGMNPALQDDGILQEILQTDVAPQLAALLPEDGTDTAVFYYGAGCLPAQESRMAGLIRQSTGLSDVNVASDLLGAARALCGREAGIACILGTGSNSCLYDGKGITRHIPPLGYILGDEGSGTALGKRLVGDVLKGLLPGPLCRQFRTDTGLSEEDIIRKVYREPDANRFLASLAPFLHAHRSQAAVHDLVCGCFDSFFRRNVLPYRAGRLPVHVVGSIAWHFREEVSETAQSLGLHMGRILRAPIETITRFHLLEAQKNDAD